MLVPILPARRPDIRRNRLIVCLRCGADQPQDSHFCTNCKTKLIKFPEPTPNPTIDLGESASFRHPSVHYHSVESLRLGELFQAVLCGEAPLDEFEDELADFCEVFDALINDQVVPMADSFTGRRDDPEIIEIVYIFKTGVRLYFEGQDKLSEALEAEDASLLEQGMKTFVDGHDYLYFGLELAEKFCISHELSDS